MRTGKWRRVRDGARDESGFWQEAVNNDSERADFHANTKKEIIEMIDEETQNNELLTNKISLCRNADG